MTEEQMPPFWIPNVARSLTIILLVSLKCSAQEEAPPPTLLQSRPVIRFDESDYVAKKIDPKAVDHLIDELAEITDPDFGFAPWMSGAAFAPIPSSAKFSSGIIMIHHGLKTNATLRQLVALGPTALPKLLDRLTDKTPTKLSMTHQGHFGVQLYGREIRLNLARSDERRAKEDFPEFFGTPDPFRESEKNGPEHVVTIGDVCFVIVGQIVNRSYQCARYQPTSCRVINSPTHDPEIARIVRSIWHTDDSATRLFNSLLDDLFTANSDWLQSAAAMRLLYYFPDQSAELINQRIINFDTRDPTGPGGWQTTMDKNSVDVPQFLESVRLSKHPLIVDALFQVAQKTNRSDILQSSINNAVVQRDPDLIFERIREILSVAPPSDGGMSGGDYDTLKLAAKHFPDRSEQVFDTYQKHGGMNPLRTCIHALQDPDSQRDWMIDFLANLLNDTRDTNWNYGPNYDRQPIRICDEAAKTLAKDYLTDVHFEYEQNANYLDRQIVKLKQVLAGDRTVSMTKPRSPDRPEDFPTQSAARILERSERFWKIHSISNGGMIWIQNGNSAMALNARSGKATKRIPIERPGRESYVENGNPGHTYAYYGDSGCKLLIRDVRTGKVVRDVQTPFHDGVTFGDPLQIRNLRDMTICGKAAEWIIAVTQDGSIHSIETETGKHRIEKQIDTPKRGAIHATVLGAQGSPIVLIEGLGDEGLFEVPLRLWDQSNQTLRTIKKIPKAGWSSFWGKFALNTMNGHYTVWNVTEARQLELPWPQESIRSIECSHDQKHLFVLRKNGSVDLMKILDGESVVPVRRFLPAADEMTEASLSVSSDDRTLFVRWNSIRQRDGKRDKANEWTKVAIYELNEFQND